MENRHAEGNLHQINFFSMKLKTDFRDIPKKNFTKKIITKGKDYVRWMMGALFVIILGIALYSSLLIYCVFTKSYWYIGCNKGSRG
jgi:hypothetical protein